MWNKAHLAGVALVAVLAAGSSAQATVYSLSGDWSDSANPNGAWSYGAGLAHHPQPSVANALNAAAANGYWGAGSDFYTSPFVLKSTANGSAVSGYSNNDFLAGDVLIHSPNNGSALSITWTAPSAGAIALTSSVWYAHSIVTRSDDISAFLNGALLGGATLTNGIDRAGRITLANGSFNVAAGDVLTFDFAKSVGQTYGSLAGIEATIDFTPNAVGGVPEPATWAMMITGFGLVGGMARSRRRAVLA